MTKDEALRLALSTLNEVRSETFRLMRNGQTLYAEKKVWDTITAIKQVMEQPEPKPVAWTDEMAKVPDHVWGKREPLTNEQIRKANHHRVTGAYDYSFKQGVRWAEAAHGIGEKK